MSKKGITLKIAADDIDFFGAVMNCAIRYCIGRETYMPGLVTDWIMEHCNGILTEKTLAVMKRDIDEVPEERRGMKCDIETWRKFRAWLDEQKPWQM